MDHKYTEQTSSKDNEMKTPDGSSSAEIDEQEKKSFFHVQPWIYVAILIGIYDVITVAFSWLLAVDLRFDFNTSVMLTDFGSVLIRFLPLYLLCTIFIYGKQKLYHSIWRFVSYEELQRIIIATFWCIVCSLAISAFWSGWLPRSAYFTAIIMQFVFACLLRFSYRYIQLLRQVKSVKSRVTRNAMIIGAGAAGQMLEKDAKSSQFSDMNVVCFIDDNPNKQRRLIDNIPVVGDRSDILKAVKEYEIEIILFAVPSASAADRRDILNICQETDCEVRVLPSLMQLATGSVELKSLRKIRMEDLLGREPIHINTEAILSGIGDKRVLVTGAGGSIGSELSRQIASHNPKMLILLDIYENNVYYVEQELRKQNPDLHLVVLIGSVRDSRRINQVFEKYRPQIVFHAAAHKHVPLMETSPCEAIKNNVIGTCKTALAARKNQAEKFVLISTDKAVNPTNIMGASKRLCEMVIQSLNDKDVMTDELQISCHVQPLTADELLRKTHEEALLQKDSRFDHEIVPEDELDLSCTGTKGQTQFVAVRFGNVLGSNGSVIPLFQKQIEEGGPVTVTHPDIIRYFMTISEAVSLVLEASSYARGGEIFVLDMGEPVRIDDLARNLIRMADKIPDKDIRIEYTGLRPGEKLYEEKLMHEEGMEKTKNSLIHIGKPIEFDHQEFLASLPELYHQAMNNEAKTVIEMVVELVGTYSPDWNSFISRKVIEDEPVRENRLADDSCCKPSMDNPGSETNSAVSPAA